MKLTPPESIVRLKRAGVTAFATYPLLPFVGSFMFSLFLMGFKVALLVMSAWQHYGIDIIVSIALALNVSTAVWQTVDAIYFDFKVWFVTALVWVSQLFAITLSASLVPLSITVADDDARAERLALALTLTASECLYTASQFSVTLEYLHRAALQRQAESAPPPRPAPRVPLRVARQAV